MLRRRQLLKMSHFKGEMSAHLHICRCLGDCLEPVKKFLLTGCRNVPIGGPINICFNELIWFNSCKKQNTNRNLIINYQEFRCKNCILHLSKDFVISKHYPPPQSFFSAFFFFFF